MGKKALRVPVYLTARAFRRFAVFDTLSRQGKWKAPALFCLILCASALVCYALRGRSEGAMGLVVVLAAVGLGLPLVYFSSFFHSIRQQNERMGLKQPKLVYTVTLDEQAVTVDAGSESIRHGWGQLYRAYRVPGAVYLYASPERAYLLPDGEDGGEAVWAFLSRQLSGEKLFDRRR